MFFLFLISQSMKSVNIWFMQKMLAEENKNRCWRIKNRGLNKIQDIPNHVNNVFMFSFRTTRNHYCFFFLSQNQQRQDILNRRQEVFGTARYVAERMLLLTNGLHSLFRRYVRTTKTGKVDIVDFRALDPCVFQCCVAIKRPVRPQTFMVIWPSARLLTTSHVVLQYKILPNKIFCDMNMDWKYMLLEIQSPCWKFYNFAIFVQCMSSETLTIAIKPLGYWFMTSEIKPLRH